MRDYKKEYARRKVKQGRLLADIDRDLCEAFKAHLNDRGITFARWLTNKINEDIDKDRKK